MSERLGVRTSYRWMSFTACASCAHVQALERRIAALERRHQAGRDPRLVALKCLVYSFFRDKPWTGGELLEDARRFDQALWTAIYDIRPGDERTLALRFGLWLAEQVKVDDGADGLRLVQLKDQAGSRRYAVIPAD